MVSFCITKEWQNKQENRAKEVWPKGQNSCASQEGGGRRGVDGTRNLALDPIFLSHPRVSRALGPNFLCHPRGSWEGEGETAQEVWPSGQTSCANQTDGCTETDSRRDQSKRWHSDSEPSLLCLNGTWQYMRSAWGNYFSVRILCRCLCHFWHYI